MTTLFEASRRLRDAAKSNFRDLPGGSVSSYLNTLPKDVRVALGTQYKALEYAVEHGGRIDRNGFMKPFAERRDESDLTADSPKELRQTISKLATEQMGVALTTRMGTPTAEAQIKDQPVTLRDTMSAAFDAHEGAE